MYIYFAWELSIFLDNKVCGFSMYVYTVWWLWVGLIYVILTFGQQVFQVKYLVGLPPKLELRAVFSSSDTVAGMYTVGHVLLWTEMLVCEQVVMHH